jgi:acyl carrier protein
MLLETVRNIVRGNDDLASSAAGLSDNSSLYEAGLSSYGTVDLMVALEAAFSIEFPNALLTRATFESISSIAAVVARLQQRQPSDAEISLGAGGPSVAIGAAR